MVLLCTDGISAPVVFSDGTAAAISRGGCADKVSCPTATSALLEAAELGSDNPR